MQDESIQQNHFDHYGNRVRVRACGVLWNEGKVLMIKHLGLGKTWLFVGSAWRWCRIRRENCRLPDS